MPFIRYNGWGLRDLQDFLSNAGTGLSYAGYCDDNAEGSDPIFVQTTKADEADMVEIFMEYEDTIASMESTKKGYINHYKVELISKIMVASTLELARYMTHKSVCVIFGRDMYPMQEAVRVFGPKLRGTWIYIEGASRSIVGDDQFRKGLAARFGKLFEKADAIYGVDTGYSGSVPKGAIARNKHLSESVQAKLKIRLIGCNSGNEEYSIFRNYMEGEPRLWFKTQVETIEYFAKPIKRSTEVTCKKMPILRMADRTSIVASAVLLNRVREDSMRLLPYFSLYMDKTYDVAKDFFGDLPEFGGKKPAPITIQVNGSIEEQIIMELFPEKKKPDCNCDICQNPWNSWVKLKLTELEP